MKKWMVAQSICTVLYIPEEPYLVQFHKFIFFKLALLICLDSCKNIVVFNGLTLKTVSSWSVSGSVSAFKSLMRTVALRKTLDWMFSVHANFFFLPYIIVLCVTNWLYRPFAFHIRQRAALTYSSRIRAFTFRLLSLPYKYVFVCGQCKYLQLATCSLLIDSYSEVCHSYVLSPHGKSF